MSRQKRVRQITYGLIIAGSGIALVVLQKIPLIHGGISIVLLLLALFQLGEKNKGVGLALIAVGIAFYLLYPFVLGSLYLLGIALLILGIVLTVLGYKKDS